MSQPWEKYYTESAKTFDVTTMPYATLVDMINGAGATYADRVAATTILPNGAEASILSLIHISEPTRPY